MLSIVTIRGILVPLILMTTLSDVLADQPKAEEITKEEVEEIVKAEVANLLTSRDFTNSIKYEVERRSDINGQCKIGDSFGFVRSSTGTCVDCSSFQNCYENSECAQNCKEHLYVKSLETRIAFYDGIYPVMVFAVVIVFVFLAGLVIFSSVKFCRWYSRRKDVESQQPASDNQHSLEVHDGPMESDRTLNQGATPINP